MDNCLVSINNKVFYIINKPRRLTTSLLYVQGRKVWSVKLPHSVLCIEKMDIPSRGLFLVAVALASNHVLVYNDKNVVDCFKMDDTVSAMKFGRFGREENTLVLGKLCDQQETK